MVRDASRELETGQTFGRYELVRRLGAGAMGVVYAARDRELGRMVALKLVHQQQSSAADARLAREARALARLSHPNVVTVYDVGTHGETRYIAMELIEGETLGAWLRAARRSRRDIVRAFIDAGLGLAATHEAGLVHRDFKPENVLVDRDGRVRVSDFGLARMSGSSDTPPAGGAEPLPTITDHDALVGTPAYMAPEQLLGRPVDTRADQFSFCVALYEALAGQRPFGQRQREGIDPIASLVADVTGPPPRPPPGPTWLRRVVRRGLAVDPADRFPSMEALVRALRHGLGRARRWALGGASAVLAAVAVLMVRRPAQVIQRDWHPMLLGRDLPGEYSETTISGDGSTLISLNVTRVSAQPRGGGRARSVALPEGTDDIWETTASYRGERAFALVGRRGRHEIWEVQLQTGTWTPWVTSSDAEPMGLGDGVDLSPDERSLAFIEKDERGDRIRYRLWRAESPGDRRSLGEPVTEALSDPRWSPDGTRIALTRWRDPFDGSIEIVDARSGRLLQSIDKSCNGIGWLDKGALVCAMNRRPTWVVAKIPLANPSHAQDVYALPDLQSVSGLRATPAGVFLQTVNFDQHLAELRPGASALVPVSAATITDTYAAGWTRDGHMVFGGNVGGRLTLLDRAPDGTLETLEPGPVAEIPLTVLGDDIVYGRFPGGEATTPFSYPTRGDVTLFRRTLGSAPVALGTSRTYRDLVCAGDRALPCYLVENGGDHAGLVEWDPRTGNRGREVARWPSPRFYQSMDGAALSPDGRRLAVPVDSGRIQLMPLDGGPATVLDCPECAHEQFLTFDPDGNIVATDMGRGYRIVRIRLDGTLDVLLHSDSTWFKEPRVSPDGKNIAVLAATFTTSFWWVPLDPR